MARGKQKSCKASGCQYGRHDCKQEERVCPHQCGECEEPQVLTFWLDKNGKRIDTTLPSGFFVFLMNLVTVTIWWMLFAIAMSVLWTVLFVEAGVTFTVDGSAIGILFSFLSLFVVGLVGITDGKRTGGASNWVGLGSATKNIMSGLQGTKNTRVLLTNPMVEMDTHNGSNYVTVRVPAQSLFKRIAFTLNAIYAAQRNSIRSSVDIKKLPLYADQKAFLMAQPNVDPIESMQGLVNHYITLLYSCGAIGFSEEWTVKFFKDKVDSLGNLDIGGKIPIVESVVQFTNVTLFISTIILPLWFSRIYPGYSTVWIAPSLLLFYYSLVGFANRQYKIAVTQAENTFSGIQVVKELHDVSASNLARAVAINRQVENARKSMSAMDNGSTSKPPPDVDTDSLVTGGTPTGGAGTGGRGGTPTGPPPIMPPEDTVVVVLPEPVGKRSSVIPNIWGSTKHD